MLDRSVNVHFLVPFQAMTDEDHCAIEDIKNIEFMLNDNFPRRKNKKIKILE